MSDLLRRGSRGSDVEELQQVLNFHLNEEPLIVDGIFGPLTEGRVRIFQRLAGIKDDGIVGPNTRKHLCQVADVWCRIDVFSLAPVEEKSPPTLCPFILPILPVVDPCLAQLLGLCDIAIPNPAICPPLREGPPKVIEPVPTTLKPVEKDPKYTLGASVGGTIDLLKAGKGPSSTWIDIQLKVPWPVYKNLSSTFIVSPHHDFADQSFGVMFSGKTALKYDVLKLGDIAKVSAAASATAGFDLNIDAADTAFGKLLFSPTLTIGKGKSAFPYLTLGLGAGGKFEHDLSSGKTKSKGVLEGTVGVGWTLPNW
ncbi:peptidoglycan-binding domain-containing protein [Aestuariibius sp. 2305UL40-4]|uniref:peptidoglycan-binding domain-containing protein n=1 Tax=Aestuariibius violaceus TaxID=3234132 RepID=UPI00345E2632